jgi:hypothetical protein
MAYSNADDDVGPVIISQPCMQHWTVLTWKDNKITIKIYTNDIHKLCKLQLTQAVLLGICHRSADIRWSLSLRTLYFHTCPFFVFRHKTIIMVQSLFKEVDSCSTRQEISGDSSLAVFLLQLSIRLEHLSPPSWGLNTGPSHSLLTT